MLVSAGRQFRVKGQTKTTTRHLNQSCTVSEYCRYSDEFLISVYFAKLLSISNRAQLLATVYVDLFALLGYDCAPAADI
jgi:hypothetical protein